MPTTDTVSDFDKSEIDRIQRDTGLDFEHARLLYEYRWKAARNLFEDERTLCEELERQLARKKAEAAIPLRANDNGRGPSSFRAPPPQEQNRTNEPLTPLDISGWDDDEVPQRDWAVKDRIIRRAVTLLSGEGGVGKSILTLQLACAHTLASDWFMSLPTPGPAFYLDAEDDELELHFRLEAIRDHFGVTFKDLYDGGLHLISLAGKDALLGTPDRSGIIRPTPLFERLLLAATNIKPVLIVVNSAADVFAGNENNRSEVRQFVGLLRHIAIASGAAVLLTSHPSLTGISTDSGLSGSTAWNNSVRSRLFFKTAGDTEDDRSDQRELIVRKSNYGPTGEVVRMVWRNGLFVPVGTPSSMDQHAAERTAELAFLDLLKLFAEQNQRVGPYKGPSYAPAKFAEHPQGKPFGGKKLAAAMQRLLDAKTIKIMTEGPVSRRVNFLVRTWG